MSNDNKSDNEKLNEYFEKRKNAKANRKSVHALKFVNSKSVAPRVNAQVSSNATAGTFTWSRGTSKTKAKEEKKEEEEDEMNMTWSQKQERVRRDKQIQLDNTKQFPSLGQSQMDHMQKVEKKGVATSNNYSMLN